MNGQPQPPGWYPDNRDPSLVRFWDGRQWTARTAPAQPPVPGSQVAAPGSAWRDRWRGLRLRTKVLLVVGALVVFGALMPDEDQDPAAGAGGQESAQNSDNPAAPAEVAPAEVDDEANAEGTIEKVTEDEVEDEPIAVPSLRAQSIDKARAALRRAGLKTKVVRQPSWQPAGEVLKQGTKAGVALAAGTVVTLVVAAPMPKVPGVMGQGTGAGQAALRRAGFKVRIVQKVVSSGADNVVLSQSPSGSQGAAPGSVVELVVSNLVKPLAPVVTNCTPGYKPCLPPASDYDCAGGSGNGPAYANGPIYVSGGDPYALDNDGDGVACET